jgi:hypothetical protein
VSNPAQHFTDQFVMVKPPENWLYGESGHGRAQGGQMESDLRRFLRNRVVGRILSVVAKLKEMLAERSAQENSGSQRMCPFCGLITPRSKRVCLECGKSLRGIHVERKDATQE